ncbi:putative Heat shock 70 kDa protein C [Hypsibius exemplaris]|uniref:Heat shock 70 kDa protein C n=1 Tax=Hypsibius exemplaris TaxID=2072580 RepID=A0A1W0WZV3_HYPEX|nr:putative Heat shock 70 kDa protein C [Hypsibius exemplaris]
MAAIGIDFGTANITVAIWENGLPRIISSVNGAKKTPTFIVRQQSGDVFGEDARSLSTIMTEHVLFDFLQFIGMDVETARNVARQNYYPFNEIGSKHNHLRFNLPNGERLYLVNVVQDFLRQAKELAESTLGRNVVMCVVTVPCIWQSHQREFLEQAAKKAGFERVFLVDAAAAALAGCFLHTLDSQTSPRNIVVVDVGASSTTAAVFNSTHPNEVSHPMWYSTDPAGGGTALDRAIIEHCYDLFSQQPGGANYKLNRSQLHRLRVECEDVKKRLSTRRVGQPTDSHILLVGGASHCGVLRAAIQKQFGGLINPSVLLYSEDAAAFGAAGIAAMAEMVPMDSGQLLLDMFSADRIAQHYHQLTRLFRDWGGEREASDELDRYIHKHSNFSPAASAITSVPKDNGKMEQNKRSTNVIREHSLTGREAIDVTKLLHGHAWLPQTSQGHFENDYPPLNPLPRSDPDHTQHSQVVNWDAGSSERPLYSQVLRSKNSHVTPTAWVGHSANSRGIEPIPMAPSGQVERHHNDPVPQWEYRPTSNQVVYSSFSHVAKPVVAPMTVTARVEQHKHNAVPQRVYSMTPTDHEEEFFTVQDRHSHMTKTRVPTSGTRTDYDAQRYLNSHVTRLTTRQDTSEVRDRPLSSHKPRPEPPPYEVAAIGSTWRNSEGVRLRGRNPIFRSPQASSRRAETFTQEHQLQVRTDHVVQPRDMQPNIPNEWKMFGEPPQSTGSSGYHPRTYEVNHDPRPVGFTQIPNQDSTDDDDQPIGLFCGPSRRQRKTQDKRSVHCAIL